MSKQIDSSDWMTPNEMMQAGYRPIGKEDIETALTQFSLDWQTKIGRLLGQDRGSPSTSILTKIRELADAALFQRGDDGTLRIAPSTVFMMVEAGYLEDRERLRVIQRSKSWVNHRSEPKSEPISRG